MKMRVLSLVAVFALMGLVSSAFAAEKAKEETLKGKVTCAKCDLGETEKCQNVLIVKDGDKEVKYYLADNKTSKDFHGKVCKKAKDDVTVTGVVSEKDGKKVLTASKIEA